MRAKKQISKTDVLRYIYQEISEAESLRILHAIHESDELTDLYYELLDTVKGLDRSFLKPSPSVVRFIVDYAEGQDASEMVPISPEPPVRKSF